MLPHLPALDPALVARGGDPHLVGDELIHYIGESIRAHPRSAQRMVGPSEIGTPCQRRLGFRLAGVPGRERVAWRPTVGTAVHSWLAEAFTAANEALGHARFLVETRVEVGQIDGRTVTGTADLYDRVTATVIDWKIVGPTTLRKVKASGPSNTYRTQIQLYGAGFVARGAPVDTVALMFLPVSGDLHEAVYRPIPYDPQVATDALIRADALAYGIRLAGAERLLPNLPQADDYCTTCPYFTPGATDLASTCPGAPETVTRQAESSRRQIEGLIA